MKKLTENRIIKKLLIVFVVVIMLLQCLFPVKSEAFSLMDIELPSIGDVFKGVAQVLAAGGDLIMGGFNHFMLGTNGFSTAMISHEALGHGSWFDPVDENGNQISASGEIVVSDGDFQIEEQEYSYTDSRGNQQNGKKILVHINANTLDDGQLVLGSDTWEIPNMLYCPENIFGNNIAMLDVNFLNPNNYKQVNDNSPAAASKATSIAGSLKTTIVSWYRTFRNLAVVALLSILVYLGIRILLSSVAEDKAKYKEALQNWLIALCLVFMMHFIMSATIMIVNQVNTLFEHLNGNIYVDYGGTVFKSNFTGVIRFLAQYNEAGGAWAYTIIYWVLIFYTFSFTIQYLKRVLYIAFYTMIAPLVAITYPIDKMGDGKSQAFNKWLQEYIMTMALQPIHLIIYSMIVGTSLSLSISNPIFAIVAIGFLIPAEKFIKGLFGVQSTADGGFGSFAGGALAMQGLNKLSGLLGNKSGKAGKGSNSDEDNSVNDGQTKIRQVKKEDFANFAAGVNTNNNLPQDTSGSPRQPVGLPDTTGGQDPNAMDGYQQPRMAFDGNGGFVPISNEEQTGNAQPLPDTDTYGPVRTQNSIIDNNNNNNADNKVTSEADNDSKKKYRRIRTRRGLQNVKRNAIKGVKKLPKVARFTGKIATGMMGGALGLAASVASGKGIEDAVTKAAAGAAIGGAIGNSAFNLAGRKITGAVGTVSSAIEKDRQEKLKDLKESGQKEKYAEKSKKLALRAGTADRRRIDKYLSDYSIKTGKNFTTAEKKDLRSRLYDYDSKGVTDEDKIFKGLELEEKFADKGYTHDDMVNVMALTNTYGRETLIDEKQKAIFDNDLDKYYGLNANQKEAVKELFYAANDFNYQDEKAKVRAQQQAEQRAQSQKKAEQVNNATQERKQRKAAEQQRKEQFEQRQQENQAKWMNNGESTTTKKPRNSRSRNINKNDNP